MLSLNEMRAYHREGEYDDEITSASPPRARAVSRVAKRLPERFLSGRTQADHQGSPLTDDIYSLGDCSNEFERIRILFVTGGQGDGHKAPALAVAEELRAADYRALFDIHIIDVKPDPVGRQALRQFRHRKVDRSEPFDALYEKVEANSQECLRGAFDGIEGEDFDACFGNHVRSFRYAARRLPDIPFLFMEVDPAGHRGRWQMDRLNARDSRDRYFIPAVNRMPEDVTVDPVYEAVMHGVPFSRVYCEGQPTHADLLAACQRSSRHSRKAALLPEKGAILLMLCPNAKFSSRAFETIKNTLLAPSLAGLTVVVVPGNKLLTRKLQALQETLERGRAPLIVRQTLSEASLGSLLKASTVIASTSVHGLIGAFFAAARPIVIYGKLIGPKHDSLRFMVEQKLVVDGTKQFVERLTRLIVSPVKQAEMSANLRKHFVPDSAHRVALNLASMAIAERVRRKAAATPVPMAASRSENPQVIL